MFANDFSGRERLCDDDTGARSRHVKVIQCTRGKAFTYELSDTEAGCSRL